MPHALVRPLAAALIVACALAAGPALAHGRVYGRVAIGIPFPFAWGVGYGAYYGYPPYAFPSAPYYPAYPASATWPYGPYGVPAAPVVYVEREPVAVDRTAPATGVAAGYWHYCEDTRAWYPTVSSCASPWIKVPPRN